MEPDLQRWLARVEGAGTVSDTDAGPAARAGAGDVRGRSARHRVASSRRWWSWPPRWPGCPSPPSTSSSADIQHQVATTGFTGGDSPTEDSLCRVVVESGRVGHARGRGQDARFSGSPWTTGELGRREVLRLPPAAHPGGRRHRDAVRLRHETHPVTAEAAKGPGPARRPGGGRAGARARLAAAQRGQPRLSTSNERLAHFAGQVSHDLKNPLTSVSLSLESLELEITEPDQVDTVARARRGSSG